MTIHRLFPTFIYSSALQSRGEREFNRQLLKECRQLRHDDAAGRRWSAENYPGGYTSYGSVHWLQRISPTFKSLERKLERHVKAFAAAVEWDLDERELHMTDCWININPKHVVHGLHLHPLSTLSGTYYVRVPAGLPESNSRIHAWIASWLLRPARPALGAKRARGERFLPRQASCCSLKVG